jgi:uncharacterized protein (DUF1778 family)
LAPDVIWLFFQINVDGKFKFEIKQNLNKNSIFEPMRRKAHRKVLVMNMIEERGRITARVSNPVIEKLQAAADLTGATLNQFLVQAALEKAVMIIDREHAIRYSREDAAMLMNLLDKPALPNAALAKAFERYRNKVENGLLHHGIEKSHT